MIKLSSSECSLLTDKIIAALSQNGIRSVLDFVDEEPGTITRKCSIDFKTVLSIRRHLLSQCSSYPLTASDLYEQALCVTSVLPTGCHSLDNLLSSGVYSGEITEFVGASCSGKTQLCLTWAVNVSSQFKKSIIYIDTAGSCSARRLADIVSHIDGKTDSLSEILSRIEIMQCFSFNSLLNAIDVIYKTLKESRSSAFPSLKGIVIDSIHNSLLPHMLNCNYTKGQAAVQLLGRNLNQLANEFGLAVIVTNGLVNSPNNGHKVFSDDFNRIPALGICWTYIPSVRLVMQSHNQTFGTNNILVTLNYSTRLLPLEPTTKLEINERGVTDLI